MSRVEKAINASTAEDHGLNDDLSRVPASTRERKRNAARYQGNRRTVIEQLRAGGVTHKPASHGRDKPLSGRAAIYLRVSTEEQARVGGGQEGYSIPYQRQACQQRAAQMGLVVVEEYVDAGFSGRTTKRPAFQKLLADLAAGRLSHVIIHKLDRLGRSKKVDYIFDEAMEEADVELVSVVEKIDGSPSGRLSLQIYRGVAHFYSDNLAYEVVKGLTMKHQTGGTPGRAPLGYLNKRRIDGVADIRWVEPDPERADHLRWAFDQYATGDWSIASLTRELEVRGLRTRATPKVPSRPVTISALHKLLVNPYFIGIVPYKGAYQEGLHKPLVSVETWLRVQDVMKAHNFAGEKDRQHMMYLKGSVWCGECSQRLIFSQNKGRGGTYDYFFCMGRRDKQNRCSRSYVAVDIIEQGVIDFYHSLQLSPAKAANIREAVTRELVSQTTQADRDVNEARRQHARLDSERKKLLEAHYAGAVPLDVLKAEMDRLTRELHAADTLAATVMRSQDELNRLLDTALGLATHCYDLYERATKRERRMFNQGFFTRLFIAEDGSVDRAEIQEPFVHLMASDPDVTVRRTNDRAPVTPQNAFQGPFAATGPNGVDMVSQPLSRGQKRHQERARLADKAVLISFDKKDRSQLTLGSNKQLLAVAEGFEPPDGFSRLSLSRRVH